MANFEGPKEPRINPRELMRQKIGEVPAPLQKPESKILKEPQALTKLDKTPKKGMGNLLSIIGLALSVILIGFVAFIFITFSTKISDLNNKISKQDNSKVEELQNKLTLLEKSLGSSKSDTESKISSLEEKITGTEGFASKADVTNLEKVLKKTDYDKDGLSDYDEVVTYGTDPANRDTDKDGFSDKQEVDKGYNPNGTGKLEKKNDTNQETTEKKTSIKVSASNYKFDPVTIEAEAGKTIRVELNSLEGKHTFTIDELNINQAFEPGEGQVVEITPTTAGEYKFYSNTSEDIKNKMEGKLIVK